jgi:Trp operon repressor
MYKFIKYYDLTESIEEKVKFFDDLFTPDERETIEKRFIVMEALDSGMPQKEVKGTLKVSTTTVTKGVSIFKYGNGIICKLFARAKNTK